MNSTIFFSICSLFYCMLLICNLFSKNSKKSAEKSILKILSIVNFFTLLCEVGGIFLGSNYKNFELLNDIVLRLMLILYAVWISFFTIYVLNVSKQTKKFNFKNNLVIYLAMFLIIIAIILLPIIYNTNKAGVIIYSTGPAVQSIYYYAMACEMACLLIMFTHAKKVKISNYTALFALVILSTLSAAIQSYYPSLLLCASTDTFVMYIAYISIMKSDISKLEKENRG